MSLRLITIPLSHYCDKARWALERSGQRYSEDAHVQGFHYVATLRHGLGLYVPVLIYDRGTIRGSAAIARWADAQRPANQVSLYPASLRVAIEAFEERLDQGFGVPGRLFMYQQTLQDTDKLVPYLVEGVPGYQKWLAPHVFGVAGSFIKRRLGVSAEAATTARAECMRVLDDVAVTLAGGTFLFGDAFTAADLTFAAFAAPLTLPPEYGVPLPRVDELNEDYADFVREVRRHPAGAFALRMYAQMR